MPDRPRPPSDERLHGVSAENAVRWARSGCQGKRRYESKRQAKEVARRIGAMRVYRCAFCRGWHLTNPNKER